MLGNERLFICPFSPRVRVFLCQSVSRFLVSSWNGSPSVRELVVMASEVAKARRTRLGRLYKFPPVYDGYGKGANGVEMFAKLLS